MQPAEICPDAAFHLPARAERMDQVEPDDKAETPENDQEHRYDIHGKRLFEINDKYYFEDIGIRNSLVQGGLAQSIEKIIENAVYLHLVRLGYEVTVGYLQKAEIDFVAKRNESVVYVQVTYLLPTEETVLREFCNLMLIKDNYPKYVVSMDELYENKDYQGIRHMHLRQFLSTKEL